MTNISIALPTILDLGIAFSMSPLSTLPVLNAQKDFVRKLLEMFTISNIRTRVGFLKYGRDSKLVFRLDSMMSDQSVNQAITDVTSEDPGYNLLSLLKLAGNQFFRQSYGGRLGVAKSLLIFNNGRSGISIDDLQSEAGKLRDMGVKIVVVGVSANVDQTELKQISTTRDSYFFVNDVSNLQTRVVPVTSQLQPGNFCLLVAFSL